MNRTVLFTLSIAAVVIGGYFAYGNDPAPDVVFVSEERSRTSLEPIRGKLMSVESFVSQNISILSPVKETMGGTFYVTEIEVEPENKTGSVKYEDGHNAFVADFSYTASDQTGISIVSFVIRQ